MRDLLLWSTCYMCNQCLNLVDSNTVSKNDGIAHMMSSLRAFCLKMYVTVDEWNDGMSYSITNYSYPILKYLELLKHCSIWRTSRCIYCKLNCFILCVFYTVDFFDIFCIHCDQTAREVLVLDVVKVCDLSFVYSAQFFFPSAKLPVRFCSMLRELHQT